MKSDPTLERLLDLDGEVFGLSSGYRVTFRARRVPASADRPHGIDYSLCLFDAADRRLVCFDNAHPVADGKGRRSVARDHAHRGGKIAPYAYADAGTLLVDFWNAVDEALRKEGAL